MGTNNHKNLRIIICDDHNLFRKGISFLLKNEYDGIYLDEAAEGISLINILEKDNNFDLILLDLNMPKLDGYSTLKKLKRNFNHIKVVVLSMFSTYETKEKAIELGANSFISKDAPENELLEEINSILKKKKINHDNEKECVSFLKNRYTEYNEEYLPELTVKEREIIKQICKNRTNKEIAYNSNLSVKTIDRHVDNIFKKMNVNSKISLVNKLFKLGLYHFES